MDEQIVRARDTLVDGSLPAGKRVHEARKRFKETRALLRLVREPLGEHFAHEDAWFRDAGRDLAAARDADALVAVLEKLAVPKTVQRRARKLLDSHRESQPPLEPLIANVADQLVIAQGRLGLWPPMKDSFDTIAGGLLRTYRAGRERPEDLHEWRKRVKEHWYHMQFLRPVWPEMMKPWADVLSTLSHALGDHHDLEGLRSLAGEPARPAALVASPRGTVQRGRTDHGSDRRNAPGISWSYRADSELPALIAAIDTRQRELESQADAIGARVYAEKPRAWLARMRKYWTVWLRTSR